MKVYIIKVEFLTGPNKGYSYYMEKFEVSMR